MKNKLFTVITLLLMLITSNSYAESCEYGKQFYERGDFKRAFSIFNFSAGANDPCSQYFLGIMYQNGHYVKQNTKKAFKYVNESKLNGFIPSQQMEDELLD